MTHNDQIHFPFPFEFLYLTLPKQGQPNLISLKALKFKTPSNTRQFHSCKLQPSEMASLSNYGWQNRKERPNVSKIKGDMFDKAKRDVVTRE